MEIRDLSRFFRHLRSTSLPLALVLTTALSATGCSRPTTLQEVRDEGVLHVITRVAPSIYYEGRDAPTGYDYELARRFSEELGVDRKSTRLNSSHVRISYAVFCLKKKKQ